MHKVTWNVGLSVVTSASLITFIQNVNVLASSVTLVGKRSMDQVKLETAKPRLSNVL